MVFRGVVREGAVELPAGVDLPDGTIVRIEATPGRCFRGLLELKGTWEGNDADVVVNEIYALRSSAPPRTPLES